ncbi:tetratricopeptide repeat protein [Brachyspira pulli]|uniref:tetratricopeptide repeat protein n=1 Tax=Brachyspira pulli TaxID=310721 RepID=UPI00300528D2
MKKAILLIMILINSSTILFAYQYESNTNETKPNYLEETLEILVRNVKEKAIEKGIEIIIDKGTEFINNRIEIEIEIKILNSYIKEKKEKEAYQLLTKLIYEKKINDKYIPYYYIKLSYISSDIYDAIKYLEIVITSYPNSKYFNLAYMLKHFYKGTINFHQGKYYDAVENFEIAVNLSPNDEIVLFSLGISYFMCEDFYNAINYLERAVNLNPNNEEYLLVLGVSYFRYSDYPNAIYFLNKLININPNNHNAVAWLGNSYLYNKNYNKAIIYIKRAILLEPYISGYYVVLGDIYSAKNNYIEAKKAYKNALQIDPNNEEAMEKINNLYAEY